MRLSRAQAAGIPIPPRKRPKGMISQELRRKLFDAACEGHGIPMPSHEFQFHPTRRWRFDFCWGASALALECQGGIWTGGRHVRGKALLDEMEKLNAACILGYRLLFCTPQQIEDGSIFPVIREALGDYR